LHPNPKEPREARKHTKSQLRLQAAASDPKRPNRIVRPLKVPFFGLQDDLKPFLHLPELPERLPGEPDDHNPFNIVLSAINRIITITYMYGEREIIHIDPRVSTKIPPIDTMVGLDIDVKSNRLEIHKVINQTIHCLGKVVVAEHVNSNRAGIRQVISICLTTDRRTERKKEEEEEVIPAIAVVAEDVNVEVELRIDLDETCHPPDKLRQPACLPLDKRRQPACHPLDKLRQPDETNNYR